MASRAAPPYNSSHLASALARLLQQYKNKTNLGLLFQALSVEFQTVEDALDDVRWLRSIATASGIQLDRLGYLVGVNRNGLTDEPYRIRIRAQVLLNISSGSPEDIYAIMSAMVASLVGATVKLIEYFPAAFVVQLGGVAITNALDVSAVLQKAKDAGVLAVLEYNTDTDANSFALEPSAAFLSGSTIVGATSMSTIAGVGTSGFPLGGGSLLIDKGLATEETLAYTVFNGSTFTTAAATQAHAANATLQLVGSTGLGYGDTGNAATGGAMAGAA